ncbi:DUF6701 domain-containing protein [Methylobacter tundripaludum]|uniref:DUF6701 domain-containing protein n=1 Tax=Methylobacter tundripaludum TaxID=173365 RepID=UPI00067FE542|nr:DUF6701 domain-containing protein [Methylobacter tundripaludum]
MTTKRNGTYTFSGLTVDNTDNTQAYCSTEAVVGGWALLVIYSDSSETFRVLNLYEGFQYYQYSSITLNVGNFEIPTPIGSSTGKHGHITWEGDPTLSGGGEDLTFNSTALTDASNPIGNQFNSVSNINSDSNSYGVDFDAYTLSSPIIQAGQTTASTVYSSGQDLVLLSAEIIAVPNTPVADRAVTMAFNGAMARGQTVTYTINVVNNGPNAETGPITVTNTPPTGLTYTGASGTGWVCSSPYTTCTRTGSLASGASAGAITLTATVAANATGTLTNTATVAGILFDNQASNNTAANSQAVQAADLATTMAFSGSMVRGQTVTYTLNVINNGPIAETGPITVTNTPPAGLTYTGASGIGWVCNAPYTTCTRSGSLASGASAGMITLTATVAANATGTLINTALVAGTQLDNVASNNTATNSQAVQTTDLSLAIVRGGGLLQGSNATYTLTVSNAGPLSESAGAVTVTDTLPTGLTFVSATGTNWTCTAVVVCTYNSSLAGGASAPTITLTVAVAVNASGTITNSATVAGGQYDSNLANNTASDSYALSPGAYAYYKMDEASWNGTSGEVKDSSGNNRNGTALNSITTEATPAGGGKGDTCRGATIPQNSSATTQKAVDTGIDVNSLGNQGTIAFWYKSNTAWNSGATSDDRTLADASNTNSTQFFIRLMKTGRIRFQLDNSGGSSRSIDSNQYATAAGTWVHIAVTWSLTGGSGNQFMRSYINGVLEQESINTNITSNSGWQSLLIGDTRNGNSTNYSANGVIDEVSLYNGVLTAAQITTIKNATHSCFAFDHLQIEHDGEGSNCAAESITVKACADVTCSSAITTGGITASLQPYGTAVSIGTSGSALLSATPSTTGTNTLSLTSISPTPANATVTCLNTAANIASCSMVVSACPGGSNFNCLETTITPYSSGTARLYTKLAGTPFSFDVVALNSSGAVESNYVVSGGTAKNVTVELFDDNTPAASCSAYANPVATQTLSIGSANLGRKTTANFSVANAYKTLRCRVSDANVVSTVYGCSSDDFSVRPQQFTLSTTTALNPSTNKLAAGEDFNLTVHPGVTVGYTGTPVVNTASVVDHVSNAVSTAELTWSNSGSTAASGFPQAAGSSVSNNFQYLDVGTITFNADAVTDAAYTGVDQSNDCVTGSTSNTGNSNGKYGCTIGSSALGPLGRFYPHHFAVNASFTPGCAGGFTYMDNDALGIVLDVTAQSKTDTTATRYVSSSSAYVPVSTLGIKLLNGASTTDLLSRLSQPAVPARSWTLGVYTADDTYRFDARNATTPVIDGAYDSVKIRTTITDATDSVQITKLNGTAVSPGVSSVDSLTTIVRFGRLSLQNAYGSELLDLAMPLTAEYWNGNGWVKNAVDQCTTGISLTATDPIADDGLVPAELFVWDTGVGSGNSGLGYSVAGTSANQFHEPPLSTDGGNFNLNFRAPGIGNAGALDITATVPVWMRFNWDGVDQGGDGNLFDDNPTARATFGIYKGNSKFIYIRELY